jgi:hypothetical protein
MYKLFTNQIFVCCLTHLIYMNKWDLLLAKCVTKVKPYTNLVEVVHPQELNHKGHLVDGALVGAGSIWP